jgi:hypothetical protein
MVMLKKVLSGNTGAWIKCVWCHMHGHDKAGYELYKSVFHEHLPSLACDDPRAKHVNYLFCSERHKQYFRNSHIEMDQLPPGYRSVI